MTSPNLYVLYLDFDGVLHPEAVYWSRRRGAFISPELEGQGHRLFEHSELLESLLVPYPTLRIVLSTSWARRYSFAGARKRLTPGLQERCIGATWHSEMRHDFGSPHAFENLERGEQVLSDVGRRQPREWLALDDVELGWRDRTHTHLVVTHPTRGISDPGVLARIRQMLGRFEPEA